MRIKVAGLCLAILLGAGVCVAQNEPAPAPAPAVAAAPAVKPAVRQPDNASVYCSGFVSDQQVPAEMQIISGEQSNYKITFTTGDYVYINRGQSQGIRMGDEFSVLRPVKDPISQVRWFKWQRKLLRAMGTPYEDEGRIRVVNVQAKTAVAQVVFACNSLQRGDIIRSFEPRPAPPYKEAEKFDHFAPKSGKNVGMVVTTSTFEPAAGRNDSIYVNLGSNQGVKVGDYFRVYRHQGSRQEIAPQTRDMQFRVYGFGGSKKRYDWDELPREVLGEGIVLHVTRNASTVLITYSSIEIYGGDYVELE